MGLLVLPASALAVVRRTPSVPAPASSLPVPKSLTVSAGNMANKVTFDCQRSTAVVSFRIERSSQPTGPWTLVTKTGATSVSDRVITPGVVYYRVFSVDRSGRASAASPVVSNEVLSLESVVTSSGATLRASNGAMTLVLRPGTFASPTRVRITQPAGVPPVRVGIAVTSAYDFYASAALRKPASLTMRYRMPVTHFQVAGTLARAIDLATWEKSASAWVPVPTSVDTTAQTFTAEMPHFSYWTGTVIQPHGTTPAKTTYCTGICHNLAAAPGSPLVLASRDSQVCYNCHGNDSASKGPAGATGRNVQAELFVCPGQTYNPATQSKHPVAAPGATAGLACVSCHDPHADPATAPGLLRSYDPITGRAVASRNGVSAGAAFCGTCHGKRSNSAANAAAAGYYLRSGGDRASSFTVNAHNTLIPSSPDGVGCLNCHASHGSTITSTTVTCTGAGGGACHSSGANSFSGANIYAKITGGGTNDTMHHDLTSAAQARTGARIQCTSCHNPHGAENRTYQYSDPANLNVSLKSTFGSYVSTTGVVYALVGAMHDGTKPSVSNISINAVGANWRTPAITWYTSEAANSYVDWGTSATALTSSTGSAAYTTDYRTFSIAPALTAGTTYYYRVRSADAPGNVSTSTVQTYRPVQPPAPPAAVTPVTDQTIEGAYAAATVVFDWSPTTTSDGHAVEYQLVVNGMGYGWISATTQTLNFYGGGQTWYVQARDAVDTMAVSDPSPSDYFYITDINPPASCPILYTWDGTQYRYITDVMGRGTMSVPMNATTNRFPVAAELTSFSGDSLKAVDGRYKVSLKNDNDEIEYIDRVKLIAVDHKPGVRVLTNDINTPSATPTTPVDTIFALRDTRPITSATYECLPLYSGKTVAPTDITADLAAADADYAPASFFDDNRYTFDLGDLRGAQFIRLVMTGWTEYPTDGERDIVNASGIRKAERVLEVQDPTGKWVAVTKNLGVIPGYTKSVVWDLSGMFPEGTKSYKVRMRGWYRSHIDQVAVDVGGNGRYTVTELEPQVAQLRFTGMSDSTKTPSPSFSYGALTDTYITHTGSFTKFGDVLPLLTVADDKFVIADSGDELLLEFDEQPVPEGLERTYLILAEGYHQTNADTVEPLPFHGMSTYPYPASEHYPDDADHNAYRAEWNTRVHVAGTHALESVADYFLMLEGTPSPQAASVPVGIVGRAGADTDASGTVPSAHFSVNTDQLILRPGVGGSYLATVTPAAGWTSQSAFASKPTPISPGTPVAASVVAKTGARDFDYWITDAATAEGAYNWQVTKLDMSAGIASGADQVLFTWVGHGEPTPAHPTYVYLWNTSSLAWDQIGSVQSAITGADTKIDKLIFGTDGSMCLRCHGSTQPAGVVMPGGMRNIASFWTGATTERHSGANASLRTSGIVAGVPNPAAFTCKVCHDTHGSTNLYHFPQQVYANSVTATNTAQTSKLCKSCHTGTVQGMHLGCEWDCHYLPNHTDTGDTVDMRYLLPTDTSNCLQCHGHGSTWSHPNGTPGCDHEGCGNPGVFRTF